MASHHRIFRILAAFLLALAFLASARPTSASEPDTAIAIINLVNSLRASYGLAPYQIDAGVMAFAQQHSEYQASIKTWTHTHSDGTTSMAHGMRENVATGQLGFMTPEFAVYTVWADAIHMDPMIGYASGFVGAGVASDGTDVYYTLNVRPGGGAGPGRSANGQQTSGTPVAVIPIEPLVTITPRPDGWNVHTVGYGQTLWAIAQAYGVPADMIRAWNSMEAESNEIYAGQKLIIRAPTGMVETLQAAAETAAAQAAAAQSETPPQANAAAVDTAVPEINAVGTPTTGAMAVSLSTMRPTDTSIPATGAEKSPQPAADAGPLAAGLLILIGGTLLVVLAFALMKKS